MKVVEQNPEKIDLKFLRQYPEFLEFEGKSKDETKSEPVIKPDEQTPEEKIEYGYNMIFEKLANEILQNVKNCSPAFLND